MSQIETIHQFLIQTKKTLALAESCTGGHLAAQFTTIANASKYFLGSIVSYCNAWKNSLLKVSNETLILSGAVSRETANEMLLGLMELSHADFGIAITGIAGPTGGTKEKPVGLVYIALGARGKKPHIVECHFEGDRQTIIQSTCERALSELELLLTQVIPK